jgi:hypothetical protein
MTTLHSLFNESFCTYLHPSPYQEKPVIPMLVGNTSFLELHMVRIKRTCTDDTYNYTMQNITSNYISNMQKYRQRAGSDLYQFWSMSGLCMMPINGVLLLTLL